MTDAAMKALEQLEAAVESHGAPTLHINRRLLRQLLEPIRDHLAARVAPSGVEVGDERLGPVCSPEDAAARIAHAKVARAKMMGREPAAEHDGCQCPTCSTLDEVPAAKFVRLLGEQACCDRENRCVKCGLLKPEKP